MATYDDLFDSEAVCENDNGPDEEEFDEAAEAAAQLEFINDEPLEQVTPEKTPWETTFELEENESKRIREITDSAEKLQIGPQTPKRVRSIQADLLSCGSENPDGVYAYPLNETETQIVEETVNNTEIPEEDPDFELANVQKNLKFIFKELTGDKHKNPSWHDAVKTLTSERTMQSNWLVVALKPESGPRATRCHIATEAIFCTDADGIRARHNYKYMSFLLEYRTKSRSMAGLKRLLAQCNVSKYIIGVPFTRKPAIREWMKCNYSVLTNQTERDCSWLFADTTQTTAKFNPEELILYCEETVPNSLEVLIANYRQEAGKGNENAKAWIEMLGAYNHAQQCFKMWKASTRGREIQLSLLQFLTQRIEQFPEGNVSQINALLGYQGINLYCFLATLRKWFAGKIKHSALVFVGPGNSGKSMFAEAFAIFMDGAILSISENNTFWKQGILGKRMGFIDDVTMAQWRYLDSSERRMLDGGVIAINKKFSDAIEQKMPPLLLTTNYDIREIDSSFDIVTNRLTWISFPKPLPGERLLVTPGDIGAWLLHHKEELDLE